MEPFLVAVGAFLASLVVLPLHSRWQRRRAAARRAELHLGGRATMRVRLAVPGRRPRVGTVALAPGHAVWAGRWSSRRVGLAGAGVLSRAMATDPMSGPDDVVLRLRLPDGLVVSLTLGEHDADVLTDCLPALPAATRSRPATAPRAGHSWWAWLLLGASALWVGFCLCMYVTGYTATVTVVGGDGEGFCDVVWKDTDGVGRSGESDCYDEPAGSRFDVRVTGWPGPGEPTTPEMYVVMALLLGLPPALVGGLRLRRVADRRRAWAPSEELSAPAAPVLALPPLTVTDLRPMPGEQPAALLARLAPYARRQVPAEGWEDARRPSGARSAVRPMSVLSSITWPVGLVVVVAAVMWPLPAQWYALATSPTVSTQATSTGERAYDSFGPVPAMVTVRFQDAEGRVRQADVAVDGGLAKGMEVDVEYARSDPSAARLSGDDGALDRAAAVSAAGLVVGLLWSGGLVVWFRRRRRAVRIAGTTDPRPALGLLTADAVGLPVVLAVDPLVSPVTFVGVPVQLPLPQGTVGRFLQSSAPSLAARGPLRGGEVVVLEVEGSGGPVLPTARATELPLDVVLDLLDSAGAPARSGDPEKPARHESWEPLDRSVP